MSIMKQEDKDLLLKDLCGRLPYGIKCLVNYTFCNETTDYEDVQASDVDTLIAINQQTEDYFFDRLSEWFTVDEFKPYLLPMSSMTEEQKIIYGDLCYAVINSLALETHKALDELIWWLDKNNFDHRGLIPKGLANDATGLNIY